MTTIDPNRDLVSLGKLAELLQSPVSKVNRAAAKAGVQPALRLNGVCYYTETDVERIREAMGQASKGAAGNV
jgi:hypothetical protein